MHQGIRNSRSRLKKKQTIITFFTKYGPAPCDKKCCSEHQTLFHFSRMVWERTNIVWHDSSLSLPHADAFSCWNLWYQQLNIHNWPPLNTLNNFTPVTWPSNSPPYHDLTTCYQSRSSWMSYVNHIPHPTPASIMFPTTLVSVFPLVSGGWQMKWSYSYWSWVGTLKPTQDLLVSFWFT